jgi:hypothetical protein
LDQLQPQPPAPDLGAPASISLAERHLRASGLGEPINPNDLCACCSQPVNKKPLPYCGPNKTLAKHYNLRMQNFFTIRLGATIVLFIFSFFKLGWAIQWSLTEPNCTNKVCDGFMGLASDSQLNTARAHNEWNYAVICCFLTLLTYYIFMIRQNHIDDYCYNESHNIFNPSHFSIMALGLPEGGTETSIQEFFESLQLTEKDAQGKPEKIPIDVVQIVKCNYIGQYITVIRDQNSNQNIIRKLQRMIADPENAPRKLNLEKKLIAAQQTESENSKKFAGIRDSDQISKFTGIAVVTFNTMRAQRVVLQHFSLGWFKSLRNFFFCKLISLGLHGSLHWLPEKTVESGL